MIKTDRHNRNMGRIVPVGKARSAGRAAAKALLLATFLACGSLMTCGPAAAAAEAEEANPAPTDVSKQELLLFWEEKELYVQTATRTAKPISQVAENMEVVTAKDILDMNARNVADVLRRVPGLFVDLFTADFGSPSYLSIQGSDQSGNNRHVTVLVDGVPWNFLSGSNADVGTIPVEIIDRIEIIKGAASSTWGSGLGGVINIITKGTGDKSRPQGTVAASYGQKNSVNGYGEAYGKEGPVGYYLYAGRQQSDGLLNDRRYERNAFFGKLSYSPTNDLDLLMSVGYSDPEYYSGVITTVFPELWQKTVWVNGSFDYRLTPEVSVKGSAYSIDQDVHNTSFRLPAFSNYKDSMLRESTVGASLRVVYTGEVQTAVVGSDISYGAVEQTFARNGIDTPLAQPELNKWAVFANDTLSLGKFAVTPGLRFDHNNLSGSFISPSLGATYELGEHAIARASVSRGFTSPTLGSLYGGGVNSVANSNLTAEYGWSYQVGVESALLDYLNMKANLFRHDMSHVIIQDPDVINHPNHYINQGSQTRQGYELSLENAPIYNLSLKAATAYARIQPDPGSGQDNYSYQIGLKYDDRRSIMAQLFGTYIWWNIHDDPTSVSPKYDAFLWDLNLTKKINLSGNLALDVFLNVHNLFNAAQYTSAYYVNPGRWVEGGVRYSF